MTPPAPERAVHDHDVVVQIGRDHYLRTAESAIRDGLAELREDCAREGLVFAEAIVHYTEHKVRLAPEPYRADIAEIIARLARTSIN